MYPQMYALAPFEYLFVETTHNHHQNSVILGALLQ